MDERLIEYIKKHLKRGIHTERIKQALLQAGHDIEVVEEHINYAAQTLKTDTKKIITKIDGQLIAYIRKHLKRGIHTERIKQALLQAGHDTEVVEEHLHHAHRLNIKEKKKKYLIIVIVSLALLFSILGYFLVFKEKKPATTAEISQSNEEALEILNKALINNDINLCDQLVDPTSRENCKNQFNREVICDENCTQRNILNKAIIQNNASLCSSIENEAIKKQCNEHFIKEPEITEETCDQDCIDEKLLNQALIQQNVSICSGISNNATRINCQELVLS